LTKNAMNILYFHPCLWSLFAGDLSCCQWVCTSSINTERSLSFKPLWW